MRHEKTFKRADGSQVRIAITFVASWTSSSAEWQVSVLTCAPKKRSWFGVVSTNDYNYRKLSGSERAEYIKRENLKHVTAEEIHEVKMELWQQMKPTP